MFAAQDAKKKEACASVTGYREGHPDAPYRKNKRVRGYDSSSSEDEDEMSLVKKIDDSMRYEPAKRSRTDSRPILSDTPNSFSPTERKINSLCFSMDAVTRFDDAAAKANFAAGLELILRIRQLISTSDEFLIAIGTVCKTIIVQRLERLSSMLNKHNLYNKVYIVQALKMLAEVFTKKVQSVYDELARLNLNIQRIIVHSSPIIY